MNWTPLEIHMGPKNREKCWENVFWVLLSSWHLKNSMRRWANTKPSLAYPFLILASPFNIRSVYHVPKHRPPSACCPLLNYLQFKFFSIRSSKIASHFKEMQILAFSHPVGSHQIILENTDDHVTLETAIGAWPPWVECACSRRKALFRNWPWGWCCLFNQRDKPPQVKTSRWKVPFFSGRKGGGQPGTANPGSWLKNSCSSSLLSSAALKVLQVYFPTLHSGELILGILSPGTIAAYWEPLSPFSLISCSGI